MKVSRIHVAFGSTLNVGNYSNIRVEVAADADLEEGEDWQAAAALHAEVKAEVRRQAEAARPRREGEGARARGGEGAFAGEARDRDFALPPPHPMHRIHRMHSAACIVTSELTGKVG